MDITSYLLGKNSSGGGGGITGKIAPTALKFVYSTSTIVPDILSQFIDASNIEIFETMFYQNTSITELDLSSWSNSKGVSAKQMFYQCSQLETLNMSSNLTSTKTSFQQAFYDCTKLENISYFSLASATNFSNMFGGCGQLTNQSLDNILKMCISATNYTGTKTLYACGIRSYAASRIQALPHYQDFIDAGWTIGY